MLFTLYALYTLYVYIYLKIGVCLIINLINLTRRRGVRPQWCGTIDNKVGHFLVAAIGQTSWGESKNIGKRRNFRLWKRSTEVVEWAG